MPMNSTEIGKNGEQKVLSWLALGLLMLIELSGVYLIAIKEIKWGVFLFALPFVIGITLYLFLNPRIVLLFLVTVIAALPVQRAFFPIVVPSQLVFLVLLMATGSILLTSYQEIIDAGFGRTIEDKLFILLGIVLIFSIIVSISNGDDPKNIMVMGVLQFYYIGYLWGRVYLDAEKDWKTIKYILLLSTFAAGFELAYQMPAAKFHNVGRLLFLQSFTVFIAFVIALNELALGVKGTLKTVFYNLVAIAAIVTIVISLNRTMWVIFALSLFWLYLLWNFLLKISLKPIVNSLILWTLALIITVAVGQIVFGFDFLFSLVKRIYTFSNLQRDTSLMVRKIDIGLVKEIVLRSPIWGHGIGNAMWRYWRHAETFFIDNDYMVLLWHYGLFGTLIFLIFWVYNLTVIFRGIRYARERDIRVLLLTTFAVGSLLMINALTETIYTTRPHMLIYMLMVGMSVSVVRKMQPPATKDEH